MKILFLTTWYPDAKNPNRGIFVRDQAEAISSSHSVEVVFASIDYSKFALWSYSVTKKERKGLTEHHLVVKHSLPIINQLVFFLITIRQTKKIARTFSPDLIHGNIGYPGAFWSWAVSRALRIPYVITEHTKITNNFRSAFHKFLTLFGLKRASRITAVSSWHAKEIEAATNKKVDVLGNIIQIDRFNAVKTLPSSQPVHFGIVGHMNTDIKGYDLLLQACALLQGDYVLHIGGSGKLLETYQVLAEKLGIKNKCVFHGFVEFSTVPDFMSRLHFFVSTSKSETFGMAMAEAMAAGLPVVATSSGGSDELINTENGILVQNRDAASLADALKAMIQNYQNYNPEKVKASVKQYSQTAFLQKTEAIYQEILK